MSASTSSKLGQTPLSFRKALNARRIKAKLKPPSSWTEDADLQAMKVETGSSTLLLLMPGEVETVFAMPTSGITTSTSHSSPRKSPEIFEHHKLTPHELKTLIELEESIPLSNLAVDTSEDATSWSEIFVAARRLIVDGVVSREEQGHTDVDEDGGEDVDDRPELEKGLKQFEGMEVVLTELHGKERCSVGGSMTAPASGSTYVSDCSAKSAASWKTAASSIAASEEQSITVSEEERANVNSQANTGEDVNHVIFKWPRANAMRLRISACRAGWA